MIEKTYPDTMTLAEARALFFEHSNLGPDGGYNSRWVRIETKPIPIYFPNTARRVEAAKLHDLHHIANEYKTDWAGETEIAAWEIASGCGAHRWAWVLNFGAFTVGTVLFPKRLYRAFIRGRHCANLYRENFSEPELPTKTVEWLRTKLGVERADLSATPRDKLVFAFWCLLSAGYYAAWIAIGVAIFWLMVRALF